MNLWRHALVLAMILSPAGCSSRRTLDPRCRTFVDKILRCDPSAVDAPRERLENQCEPSRVHCADLDVSAPDGCSRFMGCLYDG